MRNHCSLIICVIVLALVSVSCSDDTIREDEAVFQPKQALYDIELIRSTSPGEKQLVSDFLRREDFANHTHLKLDEGYREASVVEYTDLEGKSIVLSYDNVPEKDDSEVSLILIADEENRVMTHYEHIKKDAGSAYLITVYNEGVEWFVSTVDKATDEVLDFSFGSSLKKGGDEEEQGMTFAECALMAIEACVEDAGCAFMCGVMWKYCLGAIALACLVVST